jgi:hypothetical protein
MLTSQDILLINQLIDMMDKLFLELNNLGENTDSGYTYLNKVQNILKCRDPKGLRNIKTHLMMDFRMITDHQLDGCELDDAINAVYHHVNSHDIFKK